MRGVWFTGGVIFGLTVYNPNFTARRSWYMRKIAPFVWGCIALNMGHKLYQDQLTFTYMKMNDYFPLEIKRGLRDKDFRHFALFNLEEEAKKRKLFDDQTGKSLS